MLLTYMMLTSVFVIGMAMGVPMGQTEVVYENMEMQTLDESAVATTEMEQSETLLLTSGGGYERTSNLKYVNAIQKSSIWSDVKRRTLTISSQVNGEMIEKSPESLSDQELAQLKQACHDGLKCVAVDQLLVLKTIKQLSDGGNKMGVRTAITKITKVITEYTTEYHEDTYEYFEVTESDDSSKVYQSVTTIIEDNKELCKVNVNNLTTSGDSSSNDDSSYYNDSSFDNNSSSSTDGPSSDNSSSSNTNAPSPDQVQQIFQNFGTVNNYNINQGTINEATVNIKPSDGKGNGNADSGTQDQGARTDNIPDVIIKLGEENEQKPVVNNYGLPQDNNSANNEIQSYSSPQDDDSQDASDSPKTESSTPKTEAHNKNSDVSTPSDDNNAKNNSLDVTNVNEGGCGDTNVDVASSGSSNHNAVKKGYVYKGNLNNGDMKVYNINKGTINQGSITDSNANHGVISIGTINKGPINYNNYNDNSNNNTKSTLNNFNIKQYVADIDKMYSTILEGLH